MNRNHILESRKRFFIKRIDFMAGMEAFPLEGLNSLNPGNLLLLNRGHFLERRNHFMAMRKRFLVKRNDFYKKRKHFLSKRVEF